MKNFLIMIIALAIRVVARVGAQLRLSILTATKVLTPLWIFPHCVVVGGVVDAVEGLAVRVVAVDVGVCVDEADVAAFSLRSETSPAACRRQLLRPSGSRHQSVYYRAVAIATGRRRTSNRVGCTRKRRHECHTSSRTAVANCKARALEIAALTDRHEPASTCATDSSARATCELCVEIVALKVAQITPQIYDGFENVPTLSSSFWCTTRTCARALHLTVCVR